MMAKLMKSKRIYGFGINDSESPISEMVNGKLVLDKYYRVWTNMLDRCYGSNDTRNPTYVGCAVADEWRSLKVFRSWMKTQDHVGKNLDKDIIQPGNKIYSPDLCCFVPRHINNLLVDRGNARGQWPQGVCFHKRTERFVANIKKHSKARHIGYFDTPEAASTAYKSAKAAHITEIAQGQTDPRIHAGLLAHAYAILNMEE